MLIRRSILIALVLCSFFPAFVQAVTLAPNQTTWLTKHNNTILVRPEKNYPPFSFSSSSPNSNPKGLAVDYIELVARKVGATATYIEGKPSLAVLSDLESGKEGVALALSQTDTTGKYLYFSEPFVTIPAVVVTRRDYVRGSKELTLADFNAKQIRTIPLNTVQTYQVLN